MTNSNMMPNRIQIIIVLYKTILQESISYQSFKKYCASLTVPYTLLIYNNSPEVTIPLSTEYTLINATSNRYLQGAYSEALQLAQQNKADWLLLLDQDTALTAEYFSSISNFLYQDNATDYCAAVPNLCQESIHLSPCCYPKWVGPFWQSYLKPYTNKIAEERKSEIYMAFNSATLLSVSAICQVGGFDEQYPLDMLDYRYFYQLHLQGGKMYVLDTVLQQKLSLLSIEDSMSIERYKSYLSSCLRFAKQLSVRCVLLYKLRLCRTIAAQLLKKSKRKFLKYSIVHLFAWK